MYQTLQNLLITIKIWYSLSNLTTKKKICQIDYFLYHGWVYYDGVVLRLKLITKCYKIVSYKYFEIFKTSFIDQLSGNYAGRILPNLKNSINFALHIELLKHYSMLIFYSHILVDYFFNMTKKCWNFCFFGDFFLVFGI